MVTRETIGGYPILGEIGSGGFGTVYRARDPLNDRDVALKVLADPNDLERFRREARLAYEIGHPNIIRILHYGEDGGDRFIVMELMQVSLREVINTGRLTISRAVDICRQVALGLRAAHNHERKITHRDVKPDNILIDSNGVVKVSDFGIARAEDLPNLTTTGVVGFGSRGYMSPEQFNDARQADRRSDIYSLGVVLHEMLTGEKPTSFYTTPVKQIRPSVPTGLERIVEKCTEFDLRRRYQTMDELLQEIADSELINRCALTDFYEATNGDNWNRNDNWLTDAPLGSWYGIILNRDGIVIAISAPSNSLEGEIPSEIAHLTELGALSLGDNSLSGSIPPELGNLTELEGLDLHSNSLSGSIPPELGNLAKLTILNLLGNRLSGSIPPDLSGLTKLDGLSLGDNRLSGRIPPELGNLIELKSLVLGSNRLSGNIPLKLGCLTKLAILNLGSNRLSGRIPSELGNLTKLNTLVLSDNGLSGGIPPELGRLSELEYLVLSENDLSGRVPFQLGNLIELEYLVLSDNGFSGRIPPQLGNLIELEYLVLDRNGLSGRIPPELVGLNKLKGLYLSDNGLSGRIPPELSNLIELEWLRLSGNNWTGCIPRALFNIRRNDLNEIDLPPCDD